MSILYTIALCAVFLAFIVVTVEAVLSVSKATQWPAAGTSLSLVETTERRTHDLRYIGPERRADRHVGQDAAGGSARKAA